MEIAQRRNANRIRYVFGEQSLQYHQQDGSGSRSFSVDYMDISRDRQTLVERNDWLRNVGLLWLALGAVMTAVNWIGGESGVPSFWLFIGAGCYAVYHFRSTPFTILPTSKGNLLVIDNADGAKILKEITTRRAAAYRAEYDFFPESDGPEQHRRRFKWLHEEGALSDDELRERLERVDAMERPLPEVETGGSRLLLN